LTKEKNDAITNHENIFYSVFNEIVSVLSQNNLMTFFYAK